MLSTIDKLRAVVKPILEQLAGGFKQASVREFHGPCPRCGGNDRFVVIPDDDHFFCRRCSHPDKPGESWNGDRIDLACFLSGCDQKELATRLLPAGEAACFLTPAPEATKPKKKAKASPLRPEAWKYISSLDPLDPWRATVPWGVSTPGEPLNFSEWKVSDAERIEAHIAALLPFLRDERKIPEAVIRAAVERGDLAFHLFVPDAREANDIGLDFTPCVAFRYTTLSGKLRAVQFASFGKKRIARDGEYGDKKFEEGSEAKKGFFLAGQRLKDAALVLIFEAPINALSAAAVLPAACAIATGSSYCKKQLKKLAPRLEGKRVVAWFDNDDPGRKATAQAAKLIPGAQSVVWPPGTPEKSDINDLLRAGQGDEIARLIAEARTIEQQPAAALDSSELESLVASLNKDHAVIMIGGKCCVLNEDIDPQTNRPALTFSTIYDFQNRYSNQRACLKDEKSGLPAQHKIAELWLSHPKRRQFKGLVFAPGRKIPGYRNLWTGLAIKPAPGDWSKFRHLIEKIICMNDPRLSRWVLAWMARTVQDPGGERPGTSIVLRGPRGTGKGTFASIFGSLFGPHFLHVADPGKVLGRFNSQLADKVVVFLDEATWGGDRQAEGILKHLITEDSLAIEHKGKDAVTVKNHTNLIIASNNSWVIPAGLGERRFLCLDPLDDHCQDHGYFSEIYNQMNHGGREALLHDLLQIDISRVNLREAPKTSALLDQIIAGLTGIQRFWLQFLMDAEPDTWPVSIASDIIYSKYQSMCDELHERHPKEREWFFRDLRQICDVNRVRKTSEGKRIWAYELPELKHARAQFVEKLRQPIEWPESAIS